MTVVHSDTHTHTDEQFLKMSAGLGLGLFLCICLGLAFCVLLWFSLDDFVLVLFVFYYVRFSFFSIMPRDWLGRSSLK